MKLHELSPAKGSNKASKRVGRGHGSGHGKTAGKGHKGQWARSGGGVKPGFGGGQTKRVMRIPKRGFNNKVFETEYAIVNVRDLEKRFDAGAVIDVEMLLTDGLISKPLDGLKILGTGELTKAFTVKAAKFSEAAKTKIESAGGTAEVV
jgi:large subunit ribosomal protein L15